MIIKKQQMCPMGPMCLFVADMFVENKTKSIHVNLHALFVVSYFETYLKQYINITLNSQT